MPGGRPEDQVPVGDLGSGKEVTPLQRVGYKPALFVLGYIFVASIAIFIVSFWLVPLPPVPTPPSISGDAEHYKQLADAYKQAADVYQQMAKAQVDRAIQLFQLVVASTFFRLSPPYSGTSSAQRNPENDLSLGGMALSVSAAPGRWSRHVFARRGDQPYN